MKKIKTDRKFQLAWETVHQKPSDIICALLLTTTHFA